MQVVFLYKTVPQRIRKGNSIGLTFKSPYLGLCSTLILWNHCVFFLCFFSSLTYVVAMPFYSASLIETVQVRYFSTIFLSCFVFVKKNWITDSFSCSCIKQKKKVYSVNFVRMKITASRTRQDIFYLVLVCFSCMCLIWKMFR